MSQVTACIPWTLVKGGVPREVITLIGAPAVFQEDVRQAKSRQEQHSPLLRSLGLAHYWQHLLDTGRFGSLTEIAAAEGMDLGQVSRIARLAWVGPGAMEKARQTLEFLHSSHNPPTTPITS